jgi:hypothetical protein
MIHDLKFDQMVIETAANRLLMRAVVAHLIAADSTKADQTIQSLASAINAMASNSIQLGDMAPDVHTRAVALVWKRAKTFLRDFNLDRAANAA